MISRRSLSRAAMALFRRRATALAAFLAASLCAGPNLAAAQTAAAGAEATATAPRGPALWVVRDADSEVVFLGSIHLLPPDLDWRRPEIDAALAAADRVYFEASLDYFSQAKAASVAATLGVYPPAERLSDDLSPQGRADLAAVCEKLGVDRAAIETMRPWLAVMTLSSQMAVAEGASPSAGVESVLEIAARRAKKEVRTLETLESQTKMLAGIPHAAQLRFLELSLRQYLEEPGVLMSMIDAWAAGDVAQMLAEFAKGMDDAPPAFEEAILLKRNRDWIAPLVEELNGAGSALVVVGAAHLVGEGNVLELLEARGYTVERY